MATIKGQNLRIAIDGNCIMQAQSCTLHVAMQAQESSTKDSDGDWVENEIVGANWDASSDAVVTGSPMLNQVTNIATRESGNIAYRTAETIHLKSGDMIRVGLVDDGINKAIVALDGTVLEDGSGILHYAGESDKEVYLTSDTDGSVLFVSIMYGGNVGSSTTSAIMNLMANKTVVAVTLEYTGGSRNRESQQTILQGNAVISDVSINAANRETATATVQLTGVGELEIVEE